MDVITLPVNLETTSGLSILLHGVITLPDATSYDNYPLKRQEKMHLKMSSAEVVCFKNLPNITDDLSIEANSVDQEQTAPIGAVYRSSLIGAV